MSGRVRQFDWAVTPLGPTEAWPASLRAVVDMMLSTPQAICLSWGPDKILIYNDGYAPLLGLRHPEALGRPMAEVWHEIWAEIAPLVDQAMKGEAVAFEDMPLTMTRNGYPEETWWSFAYSPVRDESGSVAGMINITQDSSPRVLAERRQGEAQDRLELTLAASQGVGTWEWDIATNRVTADARFAEMYGVDPEIAQTGAPLDQFFAAIHPDDADRVNTRIQHTLATGAPFRSEYRLIQRDGDIRWVVAEGGVVLDPEGKRLRFPGVTFDITERRAIDEALAETETRYDALFNSTATGFCIIQMKFDEATRPVDYMIIEGNPAFEAMTGLSNANGKWVSDIAPGLEQHWFDLYGQVALTGETARFENFADIFGRWYDVEALRIGAPEAHRVAILFTDITERKQTETRQGALLELNDAIRDLTDPEEIAHASSKILAETLGVSRVGYGVMDTEAETVTIARDYNAPGIQSLAGVIHFRDFGSYIEDLTRGETVIFADAGQDPRVSDGGAALAGIRATSLINMPLIERGKVVALLFVNNATPRSWSDEDVALVREVAERVRTASERARVTTSLKASERRLRFLDELSSTAQVAVDAAGILAIITRLTGEHLGASVVAYADMDPDEDGFTIRGDWAAPGSTSIVGHYRLADFGRLAVQELGAGRPLIINDNRREIAPEEAATFQSIGISATVCMPLVKEGRLVALMAVHHRTPHHWSEEELTVIREVVTRSWAHIERVHAEAERGESERRYRTLFDTIDEGFCVIEFIDGPNGPLSDYVHVQANPAYVTNTGIPDVVGKRLREIVGDEADEWLKLYRDVLETGQPIRFEKELEATGRWLELAAFRVGSEADRQVAVLFQDLTDKKRAEIELQALNATLEERVIERTEELTRLHEALRQSQKMEAVGQLTGGIAHDFNNLLAGISGALELLSKRLNEGRLNGMERYIDAAQGSAQRAAALTQRLLAFSRRQTLDPKPTDANRLINGMEDLIRRTVGPDVEVEVVGAGGLWATKIDQSQLENALLNLCINARDAMAPHGGRLTIETSNKWLDERAARARDLPPGQYVSLCVTDTGSGMPPDVQAQAFDPFFTTKPMGQGTGLGLSMIHGFVRQSGGQVRIYSEMGKGTTMCLYMPRHQGSAIDDLETGSTPVTEGGHGETVLIIDDEETVRSLVAEVLGDAGYNVIEAPDGPSGLDLLRSDRRIDLLISDVGLPGGMNGRQVADAARVSRPDLKVLFITGYAENAAVGNGLLAPGMEVLTKPFVMGDLAAKVHDMIEG